MSKFLIALLLGGLWPDFLFAQTQPIMPWRSAAPYSCTQSVQGHGYYNTVSDKPFMCLGTAWTDLSEIGSTSFPLLAPDGTQAAPSYSFANSSGTGIWSAGINTIDITAGDSPLVEIAPNGWWIGQSFAVAATHATPATSVLSGITASGTNVVGGALQIQSGAGTGTAAGGNLNLQVTTQSTVSGSLANTYQSAFFVVPSIGRTLLGGLNTPTPSTSVWAAANASTGMTDTNGGTVSIVGGRGTGTGTGGTVQIQVAPPALTTGTAQNALVSALTISGLGSVSFGGVSSGTPATSTWAAQHRAVGVTDSAGSAIVVNGGQGTGTGAGGNITFNIAPAAASTGSSVNALVQAFQLLGTGAGFTLGNTSSQTAPGTSTVQASNRAAGQTDGVGGLLTIASGRGTGTGAAGALQFQVAPSGPSTGSAQNTLQTVLTFNGSNTAFTLGNTQFANASAISSSTIASPNRATNITDGAGGALVIAGGRGTGTGAAGSITIQIAPPSNTSGTAQNTLQTVWSATGTTFSGGGLNIEGSPGTSTFAGINKAAGQTDGTGGAVNLDAGRGTGTGTGGAFNLRIAPPSGTTGTTQNALQNAVAMLASSGAVNIGAINFGGGGATGLSTWQGVNSATGTTDKAAGAVNINGGQSTGTGAEGNVVIRLSPPASGTGTAQNALVDVERWDVGSVADPQNRAITLSAPNGATWVRGSNTELLTLSTAGTTTNTTNNLLPAGALIDAVVIRVTTTISGGGVANFSVGDSTTAARFSASAGGLTANSTRVGLQQHQGSVTTDAAGPVQTSAASVRITCDATPTAGVVRIIVFYRQFTAPTS